MPESKYRFVVAVLAIALTVLAGCAQPTTDEPTLKAIAAESQMLMVAERTETFVNVPKSRWPRVIASLKPEFVTVFPDGVEIVIKPFFDGGWGYFVPRSAREPPKPAGRYRELGHGVFWFHPY
jgi:hypothetical protein